ncbi:hypothetical protein [Streptomyces sp. NPDC095602]|uniref:hypothetical protein n=1 Tax=Streptomyces sp. NPDC095602 TaxID=3155819 RepID=UPI00332AEB78
MAMIASVRILVELPGAVEGEERCAQVLLEGGLLLAELDGAGVGQAEDPADDFVHGKGRGVVPARSVDLGDGKRARASPASTNGNGAGDGDDFCGDWVWKRKDMPDI